MNSVIGPERSGSGTHRTSGVSAVTPDSMQQLARGGGLPSEHFHSAQVRVEPVESALPGVRGVLGVVVEAVPGARVDDDVGGHLRHRGRLAQPVDLRVPGAAVRLAVQAQPRAGQAAGHVDQLVQPARLGVHTAAAHGDGRTEGALGGHHHGHRAAQVEADHAHPVGADVVVGQPPEGGVAVGHHLLAVEPVDVLLDVLLVGAVQLVRAVAVVEVRGDDQPTVPGESVHEPAYGIGDAPGLLQHHDPPADRADRFRNGESQRTAVEERDGLRADLAHVTQRRTDPATDRLRAATVQHMPSIRSDLDTLPAYVPGRTIPGAIKLASNEVSLPPSRAVLEAIAEAAVAGNRYPDLAVTPLTDRLAAELGVAAERIAVGCGSVSLCQQLVQATCREPSDEVVFAWRSFEAYPIVTQIGGATIVTVPLDDAFRHDLEAMAAAVTPRTR